MAVLSELAPTAARHIAGPGESVVQQEAIQQKLVEVLAPLFWAWFRAHRDDKLVTVHFLFIRKTITVSNVEGVFVLLFGPPPEGPP